MKQIKSNKAKCRKCEDVIESVFVHDFKWCSCGEIFVDGGKEYLRRGGTIATFEELSEYFEDDESEGAR